LLENLNITKLLLENAQKTPMKEAIVCNEQSITYSEFYVKLISLSEKIKEIGIVKGDFVGIYMDNSIDMVLSVFAVLISNAIIVPINTGLPSENISRILRESNPKLILYNNNKDVEATFAGVQLYCVDHKRIGRNHTLTNASGTFEREELAYCIFTSGSSGIPKGVLLTLRGIVNHVQAKIDLLDLTCESRLCLSFNIGFVASIWQILTPILLGAKLFIYESELIKNPYHFFERLENDMVNVVSLIPQVLYNYCKYIEDADKKLPLAEINSIVLTGERVNKIVVEKFYRHYNHITLVNAYGQSECSDDTFHYKISQNIILDETPIGKPIRNVCYHILDNALKEVAHGEKGELFIGGVCLSKCYLNNKKLTDEKFVRLSNTVFFRTGDIVRCNENNDVVYLGRADNQIKIHGYRIEAEEIESHINQIDGIDQSIVFELETNEIDRILGAFYTSEKNISSSYVVRYLSARLPAYMVPPYIKQVEKIPVSNNGKLDRKGLWEIIASTKNEYVVPRTATEELLCDIYKEVLHVDRVGINDSFFELGGHSLNALRVINRLSEKTRKLLHIRDIFATQTVKELSAVIERLKSQEYGAIPEAEAKGSYPMSSTQKRVYVICQMDNVGVAYNMPRAMKLTGEVCQERIRASLQQIIDRHEILRTEFLIEDGEPRQRVRQNVVADYEYVEDTVTDEEEIIRLFVRPFHFEKLPLLRVKLVRRSDHFLFLIDTHHIVSDGMSETIFIQELNLLYHGEKLDKPQRQYKDYSEWMRTRDLSEQERYWLREFEGEIPTLDMPLDYARPQEQRFSGGSIHAKTGAVLTHKIKQLAQRTATTEYMVFLSAAMVLLSRYSGQDDIVIGSPISARTHHDTESMMGMFANTLAMRGTPSGEKDYAVFLAEVKEKCLKAYENQEYPFERLVDSVNRERNISRNPLFDVFLVLQNYTDAVYDRDHLFNEELIVNKGTTQFDLSLFFYESKNNYQIVLEYCSDLYSRDTAEGLLRHLIVILEQVTEDETKRINEIEVITEDERERIIGEFNDTYVEYPKEKTVTDLFEEQVRKTPESIAVIFEEEQISYGELNEKANQLARKLRDIGVKPNDFVCLLTERSIEMVIGIYGIMKAGGAYVPIDPTYPKERINFILADCKPKAMLVGEAIGHDSVDIPEIHLNHNTTFQGLKGNLAKVNIPNDLIYTYYTSGTTGKPKGVMVEHRSVVNYCSDTKYGLYRRASLGAYTGMLGVTDIIFDIVAIEMLLALVNNIKVILTSDAQKNDQYSISQLVTSNDVEILQTTPSKLKLYCYDKNNIDYLKKLKVIVLGGERLTLELYNEVRSYTDAEIINNYGPTETTIYSTISRIENEISRVTIGTPVANTQIYVVKGQMMCGIGIPGEICISGDGLARGYLNDPVLTAEKFVDNPFGKGKMYRTGDWGRWLPDGNIEYLGRMDDQVKIKGMRIELGEIETALKKVADVRDCVVTIRTDKAGDNAIYAYVLSEKEIDISAVRHCLAKTLPVYMIPPYIKQIERIPVTRNGKLDRKALPEIEVGTGKRFREPRNETEEILCEIYKEILHIDYVGIFDDFFELGGDSIKAIRIVNAMLELGYMMSIKNIFNMRTVEALAKMMESASDSHPSASDGIIGSAELRQEDIAALNELFR